MCGVDWNEAAEVEFESLVFRSYNSVPYKDLDDHKVFSSTSVDKWAEMKLYTLP